MIPNFINLQSTFPKTSIWINLLEQCHQRKDCGNVIPLLKPSEEKVLFYRWLLPIGTT